MTYLLCTNYLPDGKYLHTEAKQWHEKLRVKLAKWLLSTLKQSALEIKRTAS